MTALLTVEGITKFFNQRRVLDEVSFSVRPGEVLGLIGPNGSGKTTLFECLAGLMPANAGTIPRKGAKAQSQSNYFPNQPIDLPERSTHTLLTWV